MLLLGYAWQKGLAPVSKAALERAIELNGVSIAANKRAFEIGRAAAHDAPGLRKAAGIDDAAPAPLTTEALIQRRAAELTRYQNASYARRYLALVERVSACAGKFAGGEAFTRAVAENFFKLMAYKDEYEVARLYADPEFLADLRANFAGDFRLNFHLAPPLMGGETDWRGRPKKRAFGPCMLSVFRVLAQLKFLRGTPFDPFGAHQDRREERRLRDEYEARIDALLGTLDQMNLARATEIARIPHDIRGYGPVKAASIKDAEKRLATLTENMEKAAAAT
jgi:indolepyruvate ferredoxin oxidoreductase